MSESVSADERQLFTHPPVTRLRAPGLKRVPTPKMQLYLWSGFMNAEECGRVITLVKPHLRPSRMESDHRDPYFRTSSTCELCFIDNPFIASLDQKIADALGVPVEYGENIQAQHYKPGQEFKPHTDYFKPEYGQLDGRKGVRGQRTWTFMVYLNDVEAGGHTNFIGIDRRVKPRQGRAVLWNNLNSEGAPNTATGHHGTKVEAGEKFIITKWFRECPEPEE